MELLPLPLLTDNLAWLLVDAAAGACAVVDPGEAGPVARAVAARGLRLEAILVTHHHHDHVGGVAALVATTRAAGRPSPAVYASEVDAARVPAVDRPLPPEARFTLLGQTVDALATPGHTRGALSFHVAARGWLFTGDTLFTGGCGRLFEGDAAQMHASLTRLAGLPPATLICCGHEYTEKNMRFAQALLPADPHIGARLAAVAAARARGVLCVPAPLAEERLTNPFLKVTAPPVAAALGLAPDTDPVEVFAALRRQRDRFS